MEEKIYRLHGQSVRVKAGERQTAEMCIAQDRESLSVARSATARAALMAAGSH